MIVELFLSYPSLLVPIMGHVSHDAPQRQSVSNVFTKLYESDTRHNTTVSIMICISDKLTINIYVQNQWGAPLKVERWERSVRKTGTDTSVARFQSKLLLFHLKVRLKAAV